MIKIIPHASNNFTVELDNGDRFEFITDHNHIDISPPDMGDSIVSRYDFVNMEWSEVMTAHSIRIMLNTMDNIH